MTSMSDQDDLYNETSEDEEDAAKVAKKKKAQEKIDQALAEIGLTYEDLLDGEGRAQGEVEKMSRDGRICICGHAVARHYGDAGHTYCKPARMECPCKKVRPVAESDDTRLFIRKTIAAGAQHALLRGALACYERGKKFEWTVDLVCDVCGAEGAEHQVVPTPVTQHGRYFGNGPTGHDYFLCRQCRIDRG